MTMLLTIFLYLILLFGVSTLMFYLLTTVWGTNEPVIAYLLSLIIIHLVLQTIGEIGQGKKK